ncbi:polysaccharide deacetylase family protein [Inhella sp.]|uniref:polysaccharide deacetylase family protein n=1 Tax=Inhella sp. TaxID=1921806 RepID=UPI0035B3E861
MTLPTPRFARRRRAMLLALLAPMVAKASSAMSATKRCALTFDDGPHPVQTARVLDKLVAHGGVPATFFIWAERIGPATEPVLARIRAEGHELANHSWAHANMAQLTREQIRSDFERAQAAITRAAGGQAPRFFRAPFLAASDALHELVPLPFVGGIAAYDWPGTDAPTARTRADKILRAPQLRDGAILVLHDVQPEPHPTPEALDFLIPELREQGFDFVTLSQLFERRGVKPQAGERRQWVVAE